MKKIFLAFFFSFTLTAIYVNGQGQFTIWALNGAQTCTGTHLEAATLPPGNWTSIAWWRADVTCLSPGNFTYYSIGFTCYFPVTGLYYGVLSDGQGNSIGSANFVMVRNLPSSGSGVLLPVPVAGGSVNCVSSVSLCAQNIFQNEPVPPTIKWYKNNVQIAGATSAQYTASATGYYKYQIVDPCNSPYSDSILVSTTPTAQITTGSSVSFCAGGNVILNANTGTGLSYQWQKATVNISGATNSAYTATMAGSYTVVVTNSCGTATSSATTVTVNPLPSATITAGGSTTFCNGGHVVLNAPVNANYSYQWKKGGNLISGATLSSYTATTGGNYRVIVANTITSCSKTTGGATVVTVNALPTAIITPQGPTTFCVGGSVILQANSGTGLTYKWKKGNGIIGSATMQNYTATTTGAYRVIVTNMNGCSKTSAGTVVTVNCREGITGIKETGMEVFPNPTNGRVTLKFISNENQNCKVILTDVTGREVMKEQIAIIEGENVINVDMNPFVKGVYLVKLKTSNSEIINRIIKE